MLDKVEFEYAFNLVSAPWETDPDKLANNDNVFGLILDQERMQSPAARGSYVVLDTREFTEAPRKAR